MGVALKSFKEKLGKITIEHTKSLEKLNRNTKYIEKLTTGLQEHLESQQLDIPRLKNYIFSIDGTIVYPVVTQKIKATLKNSSSTSLEICDRLRNLISELKGIQSKKELHAKSLHEKIALYQTLIAGINDYGGFVQSVNDEYINKMNKTLNDMQNSSPDEKVLFRNLQIEVKSEYQKSAQENIVPINMPKGLNDEQQQMYIIVHQIITDCRNTNAQNIDDTLKDLVKDLKNTYNEKEIEACLDAVNTKSERLWMIKTILEYYLRRIKQTKLETIQLYINLYEKYTNKSKEYENQKQENKNLEQLKVKVKQIVEKLNEDCDELYSDLSEKQLNLLNSYVGSQLDEKTQESLSREDLDNGFQMVYDAFISTKNAIKEYENLETSTISSIRIKYIEQIIVKFRAYQATKETYIEKKKEIENTSDDASIEEKSIIIYLEDLNGKTELEKEVLQAKQFQPEDYRDMTFLINILKRNSFSDLFILRSRKVKSENGYDKEKDYKARRIEKRNVRITYLSLNKNILKTTKQVYLVITGGIKTDSKQAEIYNRTNNLREIVINFIKRYEAIKMTPAEIVDYLQRQKLIEEQMLEAIKPSSYRTK